MTPSLVHSQSYFCPAKKYYGASFQLPELVIVLDVTIVLVIAGQWDEPLALMYWRSWS